VPAIRKNLLARVVTPGGDDPLLLRIVAPSAIRSGTAVSGLALVATGGAGGYVYSIVTSSATGDLPPGLSLNSSTGAITGTPTTPGHYTFVAQVQDAAATVYTASFSITVLSRLFRKHKAIRPGEVGLTYSFTFMVAGNTGSVTWSVVSGNLPAGLSLDTSTGIVSGVPTADSNGLGGISYFTLRATDGGSGESVDLPSSILIYEALHMPGFPDGVPVIVRGQYFYLPIPIEGGHPSKTFTIIGNPFTESKVRFDPKTGVFDGVTFIEPDFYAFGVRVTDALGATIVHFEVLQVINPNTRIQVQQGSSDVGDPGIDTLDFVAGSGITVNVGASGGTKTVTISSTGGGGGSVESVGGALPDSSGDVAVVSSDGSVGIAVDSSGALDLTVADGGGATQINATLYRALGTLQPGDSATLNNAPACTLTGWRISSKTSGSISIDVRATAWPTQPGPSESLIGNSLYNIILSAETTHDETDLSNWASTVLTGGERLEFYVVSASGVSSVDIQVSIN
jgi:hypothetical protein